MSCECLTRIDDALKPMKGRVATAFVFDEDGIKQSARLTVEKIAPRGKKPPGILAKFCPFCGGRYPSVETVPSPRSVETQTEGGRT